MLKLFLNSIYNWNYLYGHNFIILSVFWVFTGSCNRIAEWIMVQIILQRDKACHESIA